MWITGLRWLAYGLLMAGVASLLLGEAGRTGTERFWEAGPTEIAQLTAAFGSALLLLAFAWRRPEWRPVSLPLAAFFLMLGTRELDWFTDHYIADGTWQMVVLAIVLVLLFYLWRARRDLMPAWTAFTATPAFGVMAAGGVMLLIFSRLFGRASMWQAVMGDAYLRVVKSAVEEGVELAGYTLLFIGVIELLLIRRLR